MHYVQKLNNCINIPSSETFRSYIEFLVDFSLKAYLEEQHERNPLIVGVIPSFIFAFNIGPYSRMGYMGSYRLALLMW
jgi:hypothetical protein